MMKLITKGKGGGLLSSILNMKLVRKGKIHNEEEKTIMGSVV